MTLEDRALVQQWFELSDVELSWGSAENNLEFFSKPPEAAEQRIIVVEGADVGYIRWQLIQGEFFRGSESVMPTPAAVRIDVLVGPRDRRFVGLGSVALRRVRESLASELGPYPCFGLSSVHHLAARRAYEKAGFRHHYFYDDEQMGPSVAMVRPMP